MEGSTTQAHQHRAVHQSLSVPSTVDRSSALFHLPSLERTCRSSSTYSSHCSTSEAGLTAPLDTVTTSVSFHEENDEKSDVSSVSSGESIEELPPRSIFSSYWTTKGGAPAHLRRVSTATADGDNDVGDKDCHSDDDSHSRSTNTYERTLYTQEDRHEPSRSNQGDCTISQPRRRIFGGLYHESAPELSLGSSPFSGSRRDSIMRKTRSTSTLIRRPSCISRSGRSSSDRSVSFSPQVKVVVFTPPTEQWASKGWSDYFV